VALAGRSAWLLRWKPARRVSAPGVLAELGVLLAVWIIVRLLVHPMGGTSVRLGGFVALAGTLAMIVGARQMIEERGERVPAREEPEWGEEKIDERMAAGGAVGERVGASPSAAE
jgi:hypothetical protein